MKNHYRFLLKLANAIQFIAWAAISSMAQSADRGDALTSYGAALHTNPAVGPFLGATRGETENSTGTTTDMISNWDDANSTNDEDAFSNNYTILTGAAYTVFLPNVDAALVTYSITFAVGGGVNSPVRGWIDFNGNGLFDATEKTTATSLAGSATLTWSLPNNLQPFFTYARIRVTSVANVLQIESPTGTAADGEVEDYAVRIIRVYPPFPAPRDSLNFLSQNGVSGVANTIAAVNSLTISGVNCTMSLSGTTPNSLAINNNHDASLVGVRTGHNSGVATTEATAIISRYKFSSLLHQAGFKLLDIDVGDRIRIGVFYQGVTVPFYLNALTTNYYYNYDSVNKVVYANDYIDAGVNAITPFSRDMGVQIFCSSYIDSLSLTYWDNIGSGTYTLASFTAFQGIPLPVTLSNFFIKKNSNNQVTLHWFAEEESELAFYAVEKSTDGLNFSSISRIPAWGIEHASYEYGDDTPVQSHIIYYRLKMIDKNGSFQYSKIINYKPINDVKLAIRKILMDSDLSIDVTSHKNLMASVCLFSVQGQFIKNYEVKLLQGNNNIHLPPPNLNRGIYVVHIKAEGELYTMKISRK